MAEENKEIEHYEGLFEVPNMGAIIRNILHPKENFQTKMYDEMTKECGLQVSIDAVLGALKYCKKSAKSCPYLGNANIHIYSAASDMENTKKLFKETYATYRECLLNIALVSAVAGNPILAIAIGKKLALMEFSNLN